MVNLAGKILKSYEIKERIGAGGFGAVFRAEQAAIGREVAVKIILPEHANKTDFIKRFETEAQLVARLEHPHIVPLYDYWREPGGAYLVMRYLRGGSLRDSLEENGAWSLPQVAQMLTQIGSALAFAHANGVVHRDLKTDNILIDESGNAYLTDFGIAKDLGLESGITKDAILGTPAYLSPEQIRGETASQLSDIYSLGILLFETLTATKPFYDSTPATVLYKQLNDPLPDIEQFRSDLPSELNLVLKKATDKKLEGRYESALALARDFATIASDAQPGLPANQNATLDVFSITQQEIQFVKAVNPYKGLRAFQTVDADDFFGRDELINELMAHLSITGKRNDFLAVVGPSGSGKSSAVKAGMIPRIQRGDLDIEKNWFTAEIVPGTHPMEEIEAALLAVASREMPDLIDVLTRDERGFVRAVKRIIPEDGEFLLFIDQFEETFTLIQDEDERIHFMQSILNAVDDERSRIKVILTLRADFYDRPLLYSDFGQLIRKNTELVLPFTKDELEATIIGPANRVGVELESGLVTAIINDVVERPGALPLLQYALTELFERRNGRTMTLAAYQDIGGTTGALARRAEELYESFNEQQQTATRQMFMRLVTLGEGTDDTRRRVLRSELLSLNIQSDAMPTVIEQFGKYRLLTFDHDPQTRGSTIEVAHEALIRQWERVRHWLDENREALRLHRRLTSATEEWNQTRRDASFLARGVRLQQFETITEDSNIALNETEKIFLHMSIEAREERERLELERQQREEELEERARRRLTLLASVMFVAALVSAGLAFFAFNAQQNAEQSAIAAQRNEGTAVAALEQAEESANDAATSEAVALRNEAETLSLAIAANARNALTLGEPQLALALALEAAAAFAPQPVEVLRTLSNVAYSPGPRAKLDVHTASVTSVDFSRDSRYLITTSVDGTVHVVDTDNYEEVMVVSVPDDIWLNDAVMHPNNLSVAAAASDGSIYIWDFPSGNLAYQKFGHTGEVLSVDYSPGGELLASGGLDHNIILWEANNATRLIDLAGHTGAVLNVVFGPDGRRLVSSSADEDLSSNESDVEDRTVRIWDTATGEQLILIEPDSGFVRSLAYSPSGDKITYGVYDSNNSGTVRVHDALTGEELIRLDAHSTPVTAVAFNADGSRIASVAWDRTVRIWDIDQGIQADTYVGFEDRVLSMSFSADGEMLALGIGNVGNNAYDGTDDSADQSVWVWDVKNRAQLATYTDHSDWAWTLDIHPEGQLIASAGGPLDLPDDFEEDPAVRAALLDSTTVHVWDTNTQETLFRLPGHTNTVDSVRFHPNGDQLLTSSWDGQIILWDYTTETPLSTYNQHTRRVHMVRFFNDGQRFASVGSDGRLIIWDTETGERIFLRNHVDDFPADTDGDNIFDSTERRTVELYGVDISRDEQQLAVTGSNGKIYLYDIATGSLERIITGHEAAANEVRYHPSGLYLISTSWDGTVRVWNPITGGEVRQFIGHNSETFGIDFSTDGRVMLTTSSDFTVRMWDWQTGEELQRFPQHTNWVQEVQFGPRDQFAASAGQDNQVRIWRINRDALALISFAQENRFIRTLTCNERNIYRLEPCD